MTFVPHSQVRLHPLHPANMETSCHPPYRTNVLGKTRLLLLLLLAPAACSAQQPIKDFSDVSLEELMNVRVYSASKFEQSATDAPTSVTIVTGDQIRKYGHRTLADVLRAVRGFYVSYDRNYSYLGVRGFAVPGDYNTRVLLLVDGHRLNDNIYDQAALGTEFPLDADLIERVEIIRGPSSSLYGTNAFFAVVNVITRYPSDGRQWELSFEPGSFDSYKGRVTFSTAYKQVNVLLSGSFYDSQGQTLFYPEFNTPASNFGVVRHADGVTYQNFFAKIGFRGLTVQGLVGTRQKEIPTAAFGTVFGDSRTRTDDRRRYIEVGYEHSLGDNWQLSGKIALDHYGYDGTYAFDSGAQDGSVLFNQDFARGTWWTGEVRASRTFLQRHKLTLGSEVRDNLRQDQLNYDVYPYFLYVDSRQSSWNWALFAQDEFRVTPRWTLSLGLRHDANSHFGGSTNPRLGVIYRPTRTTTIKAIYGSAFRTPNMYEEYYYGNSASKTSSNLRSESIRSIEGILEQNLGPHLRMTTTVFRNQMDKLISQESDPSGAIVFHNSEKAHASGGEAELTSFFGRGLQGSASYGFVEAENLATDRSLRNSPRNMAKAGLIVPLIDKRLFAGLEAQYLSRRVTLAGNSVGDFPLFNLTLFGHSLGRHLDLSASAYNLLDRKFFDPGAEEHRQDAIQQDGRNFRVKLTWRGGE